MQIGKLTIGYQSELKLRVVDFDRKTAFRAGPKKSGVQGHKILFLSDFHLNRFNFEAVSRSVFKLCDHTAFDSLILGGDYCDDLEVLIRFTGLLRRLKNLGAPIFATTGNHERFLERLSGKKLFRPLFESLEIPVTTPDQFIELPSLGGYEIRDLNQADLIKRGTRISVSHAPGFQLERLLDLKIDLVLSGHLHGGQCALFYRDQKPYPQGMFSRTCWMQKSITAQNHTLHIVNSLGINDTLPIRWNCPREAALIRLNH